MKKQTIVNFRVTSNEGDSEFEMPSSKAITEIKNIADKQDKWVYIGGKIQNTELLTEQDLIKATEDESLILLMNALAGGSDYDKIVDINFEVTPKVKKSIIVEFEENKYAKIFNIKINKDEVADIIRNKDVVIRVFKKKLNDLYDEYKQQFENKVNNDKKELEEEIDDVITEFNEATNEECDEFKSLMG